MRSVGIAQLSGMPRKLSAIVGKTALPILSEKLLPTGSDTPFRFCSDSRPTQFRQTLPDSHESETDRNMSGSHQETGFVRV
jgi:hypothetical protein